MISVAVIFLNLNFFMLLVTKLKMIVAGLILTGLVLHPTDAFSIPLSSICSPDSTCYYILNGVRRTLYGSELYNTDNDNLCMQTRIKECSCQEMLLLKKSWNAETWPLLDATDAKRLRNRAVKVYHSDHLPDNYQGNINEPIMYLQQCYSIFIHPQLRKEYVYVYSLHTK